MACTAKPVINNLSMSNGCLISIPAISTTKSSSYPSLSIPSKPIKLHLSSSSVPTSFLSLKKTTHPLKLVAFVARTSDWAQQEEDTTAVVDGEEQVFSWSEEGGGEVDASGETDSGEEGFVEGGYPEPNEDAKLYVGNLPYDVDSERLAEFFGPAGVVDVAEVIYDRETDRSRGFAFVTMSTVEEAEKAVQMLNQSELNGRSLIINKAAARGSRVERPPGGFDRPPRAYEPGYKLYVGNLPWVVDNARLEQVFSEYGKVVDTRVIYDRETGRSRGFAFVTMSTEAELNEAVSNLHGLEIEGRAIRVNAAEEKPNRSF